jgi:hypothetical protein
MTIGFRYLVSHRLRWLAAAFLFVHLTIFVIADEPFFRSNNAGYPSQMRKTAEIVDAEENSILFLDWDRRMAYVYFNRNEAIDPLETGYWYRSSYEISPGYLRQHNASPDDFADYSKIFVLESWEMSTYAKMFLSDSAIEERTARYSKRMQLERFLSVSCSPVDEDMFVLYECGQVNRE